ncbi:hypothetical protein CRG98_044776 [Punica granatum]|uniref:Uncharacterized protein n=1 Tax=Punica granatum TaxID=22663 RepID=A0A2I0HTC5_PUNGR|nr:hypothetical protein CRG98_044776 [Punica granatum]
MTLAQGGVSVGVASCKEEQGQQVSNSFRGRESGYNSLTTSGARGTSKKLSPTTTTSSPYYSNSWEDKDGERWHRRGQEGEEAKETIELLARGRHRKRLKERGQ